MELFGWIIKRTPDPAPTWPFWIGAAIVFPVSYAIGYGLIDLLAWVTLTQDQAQGGFPHVARFLAGLPLLGVLIIVLKMWDEHESHN